MLLSFVLSVLVLSSPSLCLELEVKDGWNGLKFFWYSDGDAASPDLYRLQMRMEKVSVYLRDQEGHPVHFQIAKILKASRIHHGGSFKKELSPYFQKAMLEKATDFKRMYHLKIDFIPKVFKGHLKDYNQSWELHLVMDKLMACGNWEFVNGRWSSDCGDHFESRAYWIRAKALYHDQLWSYVAPDVNHHRFCWSNKNGYFPPECQISDCQELFLPLKSINNTLEGIRFENLEIKISPAYEQSSYFKSCFGYPGEETRMVFQANFKVDIHLNKLELFGRRLKQLGVWALFYLGLLILLAVVICVYLARLLSKKVKKEKVYQYSLANPLYVDDRMDAKLDLEGN